MGMYSEGTESAYQIVQSGRTECLAGVSREGLTRETQLSPFGLTLHIPACAGHMIYFARC